MRAFVSERFSTLMFLAYQHLSLVVQSVLLAAVIAIAGAVLVTSVRGLRGFANALSAVSLTIPSFALLGLLLPLVGIGVTSSVVLVTFYAIMPILRNAIVGLDGVDPTIVESARGMGMSPVAVFTRVRLPLAWPVILAGLRVSAMMSMGVAAIAAYALGPGLGGYIFTGLAQTGGANAVNYAVTGTVGVIVVALFLDLVLATVGRLTTSKGIRA